MNWHRFRRCYDRTQNFDFLRDWIEKYQLRFPRGLSFEDSIFTIQTFYYASKVKMIDYCGYNYFYNSLSIVNNPEKEKKRRSDGLEIAGRILAFGEEKGFSDEETEIIKNYIATHLIWDDCLIDKEYCGCCEALVRDNKIFVAKKKKIQIRNRFYFSWRKKQLIIAGFRLWGK